MHENTSIANPQQSTPAALANEAVPVQEQFDPETELNERLPIQLKLSVGASDDPLEHEADAMADRVMRMPEQPFIRRKAACEGGDYDDEHIHLKSELSVGAVNDPLEHEADATADKVMRMPEASFIRRKSSHPDNDYDDEHVHLKPLTNTVTPFIQRKSSCPDSDYDDEHVHLKPLTNHITPFVQRKGDGAYLAGDSVSSGIRSTMGKGSQMDTGTRSFMESRFGADFSDVKIHTGSESIQLSRELNARAFAVKNDIYFNDGEYQPGTQKGRHLLAHELTHVLQKAQAGPARAPGALKKSKPVNDQTILKAPGNGPDVTNGGKSALALVLRTLDTLPDGERRSGMVSYLVDLAMTPGDAQAAAIASLVPMLTGMPAKRFGDHSAAVMELQEWVANNVFAYDLLLYGRLWFADHSKGDMGSGLVVGAFQRWLHYGKGTYAINYLQKKAADKDTLTANMAARIVSDLLELEDTPEAKSHKANYVALRQMAKANGFGSFGALGAASATPIIFSAIDAVRQQMDALVLIIHRGPVGDPYEDTDVKLLQDGIASLSQKGLIKRGATLSFTAENREENEHELMGFDGDKNADWLLDMAQAFTIAADAGARIEERSEILNDNARALDQFLGPQGEKADERIALFDLRHEYITTWLSIFGQTFANSTSGVAVQYHSALGVADNDFENFDQVVAARKFKTARSHYAEYSDMWRKGNDAYPGNNMLDERFFFDMRNILTDEVKDLDNDLRTEVRDNTGSTNIVAIVAGDTYAPFGLEKVAQIDRDVSIFGMRSAVFLVYASNLSIHNMLLKSEVGSKDFRAEQGKVLSDMRADLKKIWDTGDYDTFFKNTDSYQKTFDDVVAKIKHEAKIDLLRNLAITLIAALVTEGAALVIRLAALSETLALARTARAISTMSTLVEVGVFTTTELTLEHVVFGKDVGPVDILKAGATNLAFAGVLKGVGTLAEPLAKGSNLRRLLFMHLVSFSGMAAMSATMTRIETGQWPPDMAAFLAQTATTYLLVAGMHHTFEGLVAKPAITNAAKARLENLNIANEELANTLRLKVKFGILSKGDFEAMRAERIRLIEEAREVGKVLKDGGVITDADMKAIDQMADNANGDAKGASFPLIKKGIGKSAGGDEIKALPAPDSVLDLVRVGDTDTYVYDPSKPRAPMDEMLDKYKEKGFTVSGNNELLRIVDPMGRTRFMLTSAPQRNLKSIGPLSSGNTSLMDMNVLERATGLSEPQLSIVRANIAKINADAIVKLPAEYPDYTVVSTLNMMVEQISSIAPGWPIDAVRGLADMMPLERGISRRAVRNLIQSVNPQKLPELLSSFHDIVNSPNVSPGTKYLISESIRPKNSIILIEAYREIQKRGLQLPEDMDEQAVHGLLRQIDKMPGGWLQWLSGIPKEKRGSKLRAASGLVNPTVLMPENITQLLGSLTADIAGHAGLNPLAAADGEAFVHQLENQPGAGKFAEADRRLLYIVKVDELRSEVADVQQNKILAHGDWENIVGDAKEIRKTAAVLLTGGTVHVSAGDVGPKGPLPVVDLSNFTMPGGNKIINAPADMNVHLDLLFTEANGTLVALEITTAELGLPEPCAALDPKNPAYGADIDWSKLDKKNASHRKFMQAIKIYQLNKMATTLHTAWSGGTVNPASIRFDAGDFTVPAARALEDMGFVLEIDGTRVSAAQIEALKKPTAKPDPKAAAFQKKIGYKPNQFAPEKISYKPGKASTDEIERYYGKSNATGPDKDGMIKVKLKDNTELDFYPETKEAEVTRTFFERPAVKLDPKTPHSVIVHWGNIDAIPGIKIYTGNSPIVYAKDFWAETGTDLYDIVYEGKYYVKYDAINGRVLFGDVQTGAILGFYLDDVRNYPKNPNPDNPYFGVLIKDPLKDMPAAIEKLKVYFGLTGTNIPLKGTFSSGAQIVADPNKTTTIIGSFIVRDGSIVIIDMPQLFDNFGNLKNADFGARKGGFNVLNVGEGFYEPGSFFDNYNRKWLLEAIGRDDDFYAASDPTDERFIYQKDSNNNWIYVTDPVTGIQERKRSGFGKEVQIMEQNGYKYDAVKKMFKK